MGGSVERFHPSLDPSRDTGIMESDRKGVPYTLVPELLVNLRMSRKTRRLLFEGPAVGPAHGFIN